MYRSPLRGINLWEIIIYILSPISHLKIMLDTCQGYLSFRDSRTADVPWIPLSGNFGRILLVSQSETYMQAPKPRQLWWFHLVLPTSMFVLLWSELFSIWNLLMTPPEVHWDTRPRRWGQAIQPGWGGATSEISSYVHRVRSITTQW